MFHLEQKQSSALRIKTNKQTAPLTGRLGARAEGDQEEDRENQDP